MSTFSTDKNPTFTYPATGTYTINLVVSLPSGKSGTTHQTIDVFQLSDVSYTYSAAALVVTFTDTSVAPNIVSWLWEFDDGTTSSDQNPVHTFPFAFNYEVSLTIKTLHNGIGFTSQNITVVDCDPPIALFDATDAGLLQIFSDDSTFDCDIVTWLWDFGDGLGTSTETNPQYIYGDLGTYSVSLTVTDSVGNSDTIIQDVVVSYDDGVDWCQTFDFTTGSHGFTTPNGTYVTSVGFQITDSTHTATPSLEIDRSWSSGFSRITSITLTAVIAGTGFVGNPVSMSIFNGTTAKELPGDSTPVGFGSITKTYTFSHLPGDINGIAINMGNTSADPTNGFIGTYTFTSVTIEGHVVTPPFGADNC